MGKRLRDRTGVVVKRLPNTNLEMLGPSRKRLRVGDVFVMQVKEVGFLFGRVISTTAEWQTSEKTSGVLMVYVYNHVSQEKVLPDRSVLSPDNLLIPPKLINRLGWSRGYFETVANYPLESGDALPVHCFWHDVFKKYFTEEAMELPGPVGPTNTIGELALGNYRTLDDEVSTALGIAQAPYDDEEVQGSGGTWGNIVDVDSEDPCLTFACVNLPVNSAIIDAGHEPNGYFWEDVARFVAPDLVKGLDLDSEADVFRAYGPRADLERLHTMVEPLLTNPQALGVLLEQAHTQQFAFDD